jgi:hypothetical protein
VHPPPVLALDARIFSLADRTPIGRVALFDGSQSAKGAYIIRVHLKWVERQAPSEV